MNPSIGVIKYSLHKQIRELYEKKDAVNTEVEKLEIQSQINALYDKIENLGLIGDNWEDRSVYREKHLDYHRSARRPGASQRYELPPVFSRCKGPIF